MKILELITTLFEAYRGNNYKPIELTKDILNSILAIEKPIAIPVPFSISPEMAQYILDQYNEKNRNATKSTVESYAQQIIKGEWKLNGENLIFTNLKRLADGQHRLKSCVKSNLSITIFITCGVEDASSTTVDTGKNRSTKDVFSFVNADKNTQKLLSEVVKQAMYYQNGTLAEHGTSSTRATAITNTEAVNFYSKNQTVCDTLYTYIKRWKDQMSKSATPKLFTDREFGFALYAVLNGASFIEIDSFMSYLTVEKLAIDHQLFQSARKYFNAEFADKTKHKLERNTLFIRVWNYYIDGNWNKTVRGKSLNDAIPRFKVNTKTKAA